MNRNEAMHKMLDGACAQDGYGNIYRYGDGRLYLWLPARREWTPTDGLPNLSCTIVPDPSVSEPSKPNIRRIELARQPDGRLGVVLPNDAFWTALPILLANTHCRGAVYRLPNGREVSGFAQPCIWCLEEGDDWNFLRIGCYTHILFPFAVDWEE